MSRSLGSGTKAIACIKRATGFDRRCFRTPCDCTKVAPEVQARTMNKKPLRTRSLLNNCYITVGIRRRGCLLEGYLNEKKTEMQRPQETQRNKLGSQNSMFLCSLSSLGQSRLKSTYQERQHGCTNLSWYTESR